MSVYGSLAGVYDRLMAHVDYSAWVEGLTDAWRQLGKAPETVLDLGCGTGSLLIPLAAQGYRVTGIDNAPDMLAACQDKLAAAELTAGLWEMDIRSLRLPQPADAAICLCDTLNYLRSEKDLSRAFKSVARCLKNGGSFIFDLRTLHYYRDILGESQWVQDEGDVLLIWDNDFSQPPEMMIDLTYFIRQKNGLYQRLSEEHLQRYFSPERVLELLAEAGLRVQWSGGDFTGRPLEVDGDERIYFAAVKQQPGMP